MFFTEGRKLEVGHVLFEVIFFLENELSPFFMHDFYFVTGGDDPQDRRNQTFSELVFCDIFSLGAPAANIFTAQKGLSLCLKILFFCFFTSNLNVFVTEIRGLRFHLFYTVESCRGGGAGCVQN
jgi:hypothetical protein